jgi:hypothetical protein
MTVLWRGTNGFVGGIFEVDGNYSSGFDGLLGIFVTKMMIRAGDFEV